MPLCSILPPSEIRLRSPTSSLESSPTPNPAQKTPRSRAWLLLLSFPAGAVLPCSLCSQPSHARRISVLLLVSVRVGRSGLSHPGRGLPQNQALESQFPPRLLRSGRDPKAPSRGRRERIHIRAMRQESRDGRAAVKRGWVKQLVDGRSTGRSDCWRAARHGPCWS